jgi:hypothetical protein
MNIVAVARIAKLYGLPIVLSTVNVKSGASQPTVHQLADVPEGVEAFDRTTINAWEDEAFVSAVKATGRKSLLMAASHCRCRWRYIRRGAPRGARAHRSGRCATDELGSGSL